MREARIVGALALVLGFGADAVLSTACDTWGREEETLSVEQLTGGDPARGAALAQAYGCGACHEIPGVAGAVSTVGPSLARYAGRGTIAGRFAASPARLVEWIRTPQALEPGNVMPDLGVSEQDGRDIAAYLYTLR